MTYERENIRRMAGYTPGEQPESKEVIKLNTNENPYPPAPAVLKALSGFDAEGLRRYPSPTAESFRRLAAGLHDVRPENIIATRGGDELVRLVITTYVDPSEKVGMTDPTYSLYPVLAQIQNCPVLKLRLDENWSIPQDFAGQCNQAAVRLAMIVNPHAPTGQLLDKDRIKSLCHQLNAVLLVDEAYVDFIDPDENYNIIPLIKDCENLIILRTLSKGYSLAGLRFGYGMGHENIIRPMLEKTRDSYNLDSIAQSLAGAALESQAYAKSNWARIREQRQRVSLALQKLGLEVLPSQTNFLLVTLPADQSMEAFQLYGALKNQGILVRYFDEAGLKDKIRISIGTEAENTALLSSLAELLSEFP